MSDEIENLPQAVSEGNIVWVDKIGQQNNGAAAKPFTEQLKVKMEGLLQIHGVHPEQFRREDVAMVGALADYANLEELPESYRAMVARARHAHAHDGRYN